MQFGPSPYCQLPGHCVRAGSAPGLPCHGASRTDTWNLSGGQGYCFGSLPFPRGHDFHKIFRNITLPAMSACVTTSQSLKARGICQAAQSYKGS